jgi:hypothetical protein
MKPKVPLILRNAKAMKKTASDYSELRKETTGVSIIVTFTISCQKFLSFSKHNLPAKCGK